MRVLNPVPIDLHAYPADDRQFRARATELIREGIDRPPALQEALRPDYPRALVADGIKEGAVERWYAYRDGRFGGDE